jgi:hypothetical protein
MVWKSLVASRLAKLRATFWLFAGCSILEQGSCSALQTSYSGTASTRARFLSASAAAFFGATTVLGSAPEQCEAKMEKRSYANNPRYIDREMEMKYADGPGTQNT